MKEVKPIDKESKTDLQKAAAELSNKIKDTLGEVELWYRSNRLWRAIDEIPEK